MADPLSIAASIAGLLSLTHDILSALINYSENVGAYRKEFMKITEEVRGLSAVLHALRLVIERMEQGGFSMPSVRNGLNLCLCDIDG